MDNGFDLQVLGEQPRWVHPDPSLPPVFTTAQALAVGLSPRQVEARAARGAWHRLERGVFCSARTWESAGDGGRPVLLARAAVIARPGSGVVVSHAFAAAVHGLPVPRRALERVTLTLPPASGRKPRRTAASDLLVAALDGIDVTVLDGLPVTSLARTVADCLRHLPPMHAVPVADAALRRRTAIRPDLTAEQVLDVLQRQAGWPFAARARRALALVDPRRETALESQSAVVMHQHGLPAATPQVAIHDERGRFVGRVDFAWLDHGVVGEADGSVKYGSDAARVRSAEKDRQALLEALGLVVVRWEARHLYGDPPVLVQRLLTALAAGDRRRFRGTAA